MEKKARRDTSNVDMGHKREVKSLHTGFDDHLTPLKTLDLSKINSINDLVVAMGDTAFGGRTVGEAADVLEKMTKDKECKVVLTLSGAMTVAKMGMVICDMIDLGMVHAIVSTGALMAHGFIEGAGMKHFKWDPSMKDSDLYMAGYDRVYDTLELEKNLDDAEVIVKQVFDTLKEEETYCSYKINQVLGKYLAENVKGRAVLKSAYLKNVPVYVPAFSDSELGLDWALFNRRRILENKKTVNFNPFVDLEHYTAFIKESKKIGIFTIGGGVPRNWAQQVGPYLDIINSRIGTGGDFKRFHYAVRICPEPAQWGGLSGCTYSEGVSWGKFVPKNEGGMWAEVPMDATVAWPLIVKAVMERMGKKK